MRLIVVSNRLPFKVSFKDGVPEFKPRASGLITGLWCYLGSQSIGWHGPPGLFVDRPLSMNYYLLMHIQEAMNPALEEDFENGELNSSIPQENCFLKGEGISCA